jgi:H/ACA ribonucleoprotein complex non-core subunit NAF1
MEAVLENAQVDVDEPCVDEESSDNDSNSNEEASETSETSDDEDDAVLTESAYLNEKQGLDSLLKGKGFVSIEDDEEDNDLAFEDEQEVLVAKFDEFGEKFDQSMISESYELQRLGKISSIIENSIIVQSLSDIINLDVDTLLLFKDRRILGKIVDLFGPVRAPLYIVKVDPDTKNYVEENLKEDSSDGLQVFYVKECSKFVLPAQLMKADDNEAIDPNDSEVPNFSDDEKEQEYLSKLKPSRNDKQKKLKRPSLRGADQSNGSSAPFSHQPSASSHVFHQPVHPGSIPQHPVQQMHYYPMPPQNQPSYYAPQPPAIYYTPPAHPPQFYAPNYPPYPPQHPPQHQQPYAQYQYQGQQFYPQANSEVKMPVFYSPPRRRQ